MLHNEAEQLRADRQLLIASYLGEHTHTPAAADSRGRTRTRRMIVSPRNLEDLLATAASPVELLRNSQAGPNVYPGVRAEYTNWLDEQQAWQKTCVLFNQTYHMADLAVEGPDALKLLSHLAVNSFDGFVTDRAKHFVPCTPDGYVIGDVILFALAENTYNLVGRAPALNWIRFHAETGGYDVRVELDQRTAMRSDGLRKSYRFQVQGPNAMQVIEKVLGHVAPGAAVLPHDDGDDRGQKRARAPPRHGRPARLELFGPWDDRDAVREAIVTAGEEFGLRQVGGRAYSSNTLESGWIPSPLPAVYSGESLKPYREWLPANGYEGSASIGGSFSSQRIEDYYFTPWDLGYGNYVKFDHDFIGRDALERMAEGEHRQKVTLALDDDDVTRTIGTCSASPGTRSSSTGRRPSTRCTRSTASPSTARPSASRPGSATAPTRARCSRSPSSTRSTRSPGRR